MPPKRRVPAEHFRKDGAVYTKYGAMRLKELRQRFGPLFARGHDETHLLRDVFEALDEGSMLQLIHDAEK
ncbi:MAG TPA: hypothetical protein VH855_11840 [Acetobacteraceae bacterium]|jgi:hypothetical protein